MSEVLEKTESKKRQEWEEEAHKLLEIRYNNSQESFIYQRIPDKDGGDGGIDSYSTDGNAYQMYAPETETTKSRAEGVKKKIRNDIKKLIDNEETIKKTLGSNLIKNWILVIPNHESKKTHEIFEEMENKVKEANLPYIESNYFKIAIWDKKCFHQEKRKIDPPKKIDTKTITQQDIENKQDENPEFLKNISDKLKKKMPNKTDKAIKEVLNIYFEEKIFLDKYKQKIDSEYPDLEESITELESETMKKILMNNLNCEAVEKRLEKRMKEISLMNEINPIEKDRLITGMTATWLMDCTIDINDL